MKLVEDWKRSWSWFSVQSMGLSTVLLAAWAAMPDDLKAGLPSWLVPVVAVSVLLLGIAGRLLVQGRKS